MSNQHICPQCLDPIDENKKIPYTHECGYRIKDLGKELWNSYAINLSILSHSSKEGYTVEKLKNISKITGMNPLDLYKLAIHNMGMSGHDRVSAPCPRCKDGHITETWFKVKGKKLWCCLNCGAHT